MKFLPEEEDDTYLLLNEGLALYRAGHHFEAHEFWEYAWKAEVGRSKLMLQALIQIAAALYKHRLGNRRGPSKLLAKAVEKLEDVRSGASAWFGIDVVRLHADATAALAEADRFAIGQTNDLAAPRLPEVTGPDGILYLHGLASGPSSFKATQIVPQLRAAGYHVEVPDLNEGDFAGLTVSRALALAGRLVRNRTIVIGSSFGGYVASLLAARDDRIKGLVLMAPAFDIAARLESKYGSAAVAAWQAAGRVDVEHYAWGGMHPLNFSFIEDARRHPACPPIRVPTYVLQGAHDDVVPEDVVRKIASNTDGMELDVVDDDHGLGNSVHRAANAVQRQIAQLSLKPQSRPLDPAALLARVNED